MYTASPDQNSSMRPPHALRPESLMNGVGLAIGSVHRGVVKRYNSSRGFGFITAESNGSDIFVYHRSILMDGFRELHVGERVQFTVGPLRDTVQALNVVRLVGEPHNHNHHPQQEQRVVYTTSSALPIMQFTQGSTTAGTTTMMMVQQPQQCLVLNDADVARLFGMTAPPARNNDTNNTQLKNSAQQQQGFMFSSHPPQQQQQQTVYVVQPQSNTSDGAQHIVFLQPAAAPTTPGTLNQSFPAAQSVLYVSSPTNNGQQLPQSAKDVIGQEQQHRHLPKNTFSAPAPQHPLKQQQQQAFYTISSN